MVLLTGEMTVMARLILSAIAFILAFSVSAAGENEFKTPIPGVRIEVLASQRLNYGVLIPLRWHNESGRDFQILVGNRVVGDDATYAVLDSGDKIYMYIDEPVIESVCAVPHMSYLFIPKVGWNVGNISSLVVEGRAPGSPKSTSSNYYGEYAYTIGPVAVPKVKLGPTDTSAFLNPDFTLGPVVAVVYGPDLLLEYTLTNNTSKQKELYVDNYGGFAYDQNGVKHDMSTSGPNAFPPGVPVKITTTIRKGTGVEKFTGIEVPFRDPDMPWEDCCFRMWDYIPE